MNTSPARESFGDLEGMLRLAVEQIASAPPPVEVAQRVLGRAAKWNEAKSKSEDPHPSPLPKGEGARRRLYLAAGAALALVVLVAITIALVGGLPREKTIAVPPQVKETELLNNTEPKNKTEPQENPPDATFGNSPAFGLGGVASPPADNSPDMRLGMQPRTGFGGSGGFGAGGGVPSKRGGAVAKEEQASKIDQERMVGTWAIVNEESKRTAEMWAISEDRILMYANYSGMTSIWHFHRLDAGKDPKQIDITVTKVNGSPSSPIGIIKGIYVLNGDELRLCLAEMGKDRPATFPEKPGPGEVLILHRGKLGASPPKEKEEQPRKEKPAAEKPAAEKPAEKTITVRGKVVDDATGKPIAALVVQAGKLYPANPKRVIWGYKEDRFSAADGSFSTTIRWDEGWTARIMADGYFPQPVLSAAPPAGKDEMEVTIRLVRIPDKVRGVVLDHTGKPLNDAAVYAVGPSLTLAAGEAWLQLPEGRRDDRVQPVHTDAEGRFELPTGGAFSLGVSHARFDAWPVAIPPSGEITIRLPEPARVEVNLDIDGAEKEGVIFYQLLSHLMPEFAVGDRGGSIGCLTSSRYMKIANPGKLVLAALPPGKYQLARQGGVMLDRQIFEVKSGETKTFDFVRGKGARVRGKVTWPADARLMSIVVSVLSEKNEVLASTSPGGDGTFLTERIPPGKHQLIAYAFAEQTPERLRNTSPIIPSYEAQILRIEVPTEGEVKGADLALKLIRAEEPKKEPPAKEKPAAEKPAEKPVEKPAERAEPAAKPAAPQKNPLLGEEAAERVKKFPPSFSKAQEGLELGIAIASDRKAFHEGERVPLEFVIRNVSQKTLVVQHSLYPPETPPTVTGADGKQLSIEEILLAGANRRYRDILKPNEVAVYRHMGLGLGEKPEPPGTFWHPFLKSADAIPGKYRLSQQARITVREEGRDDGGTAFFAATGEVQFEIVPADPKKGPEKPAERPVDKPAEKPAQPEASAEEPKGKGGPPAYREAFTKAIQGQPNSAQKGPEMLTPEEAIKQRSQEKVTVQFKVASVKMGWSSGRIPKGAKTSQSWFQLDDGNNFSVVLKGGPTYRLEQLGIDATRHFEGKVVRATGRVLGEQPPFSIGVDDLDQFEVVLKPYEKEEPAAKKDQKASQEKPAKDEKLPTLIDKVLAAHDGEDKLSKLQFTVTVKHSNGETQQYFVQPPKNFRWETTHPDRTGKRIVILFPEGRRWWTKEPGRAATEFIPTGLEPLSVEGWFDYVKFFGPRQVLRLKDADHKVTLLDEEAKIDGRAAVGVQVTGPHYDHKMYFDKETHLLLKGVGSDILREVTFSDYKKFDGIPIAQKEHDGHFEPEVTDFRAVDKFDDKLFEQP